MNDNEIKAMTDAGAKRWQNNGKDRLYINADVLGYEWTKYNTGNIHTASLNGEWISNCEMNRVLAAKTYIDCTTGKLHTTYTEPRYTAALEAFIASTKEN